VVGGPSRAVRHLHFAPKPKRRRPLRWLGAVLVVLVVLALAASVKAATAANPALKVRATIAPTAVLAGPAPRPAWPATGEAAVEVEGLPPLGHSGPTTPEPIASLAKVMTAYVVLRDHPLASGHDGFSVTVGGSDVADYEQRLAQAESVVPVSLGEQLSERQLLQGLLVASGNNFATLLADFDAGSEPRFVAKMQSEAGRLGMGQTTYTDPSGLSSSTVSDAADQLVLAAQAMTVPAFAETVAMTSVTLPLAGTVANFNTAVGSGGYVGIKTGSDFTAGGCLMFANRQAVGGHQFTILGVVLVPVLFVAVERLFGEKAQAAVKPPPAPHVEEEEEEEQHEEEEHPGLAGGPA